MAVSGTQLPFDYCSNLLRLPWTGWPNECGIRISEAVSEVSLSGSSGHTFKSMTGKDAATA